MLDRHVPDRCPIAIFAAPIRPVLGGGAESPIGGRLGFRRLHLWQGVNGPRIIGTTGTKLLYFDRNMRGSYNQVFRLIIFAAVPQ
jgi:hypothetical protein